jgi:hypothetical protein
LTSGDCVVVAAAAGVVVGGFLQVAAALFQGCLDGSTKIGLFLSTRRRIAAVYADRADRVGIPAISTSTAPSVRIAETDLKHLRHGKEGLPINKKIVLTKSRSGR